MTEPKRRKRPAAASPPPAASPAPAPADPDKSERALGRAVALGLPLATIVGAIVVGVVASVGSALLVVAAGTLLGTIAFLWASVRTLTGDAPLPASLAASTSSRGGLDALDEEKRRVLRSLKDVEAEHAIGKIDDEDYEEFVHLYREQAKAVMREIDSHAAPALAEAERVADEYLAKRGLGPNAGSATAAEDAAAPSEKAVVIEKAPEARAAVEPRRSCATCGVSNEIDAAFCKKCGASLRSAAEGDDASA